MKKTLALFFILQTVLFASEKTPPNILMIAIDDLNNWIGAVGGPAKTPNIDRLASQSTLFRNAHCVTPACNPSRTALMTGQRPETTGQFRNEGNFRDNPGGAERITIAQFLRKRGYYTVGAGKIFHKQYGEGDSPDPYSDPISWDEQYVGPIGTPGIEEFIHEDGYALWNKGEVSNGYLRKFGVWGSIDTPKEETGDWKMVSYCAEFLKKEHDKPFFLACGIFRPHAPLLAPKEYFDRYPLDKVLVPYVPEDDFDDIPPINHENFSTEMVLKMREKGEWQKAIQAYLASISFADDCVGKMIEALENSQYVDNTIIILWSDHGWHLGHKNRWEKYSNWHQATNAPMMIRLPRQSKGAAVDASVSYLDIYPTIVELLNFEKPDYLEGNSFKEILTNPKTNWDHPAVVTFPKGNYSVHYKHWNYILYENGAEELYDHRSDPNEFINLVSGEEYAPLIKKLKDWIPEDDYPE